MKPDHGGRSHQKLLCLRVLSVGDVPTPSTQREHMPLWALAMGRTREVKIYFSPREFITTSPQIHGFVAGIHTTCVAQNTPIQKFSFNWSWIGSAVRHLANTL